MKRRTFFGLVGSAVAWPVVAHPQQPAKMKRIAIVSPAGKIAENRADPNGLTFREALSRLGYTEGQNLIIDYYSAEGHKERYVDLAREIVNTRPDVICSIGAPLTREFKVATSTIPIVAFTGDPVRLGIVSSIAHPGGNVTGVSVDAGLEIWGKRLELLVEAVPKISRVAFISSPGAWENPGGKSVQEVARGMGILVKNAPLGAAKDEAEYRRVLSSIQPDQVDGIAVAEESETYAYRFLLVQLVAQLRILAIYVYRDQTEAGGLMSYSYDFKNAVRTSARQVVDILHGANPSEMPYEQASRFELVINLKTAKALGLEIPAGLVAGAAAVIE